MKKYAFQFWGIAVLLLGIGFSCQSEGKGPDHAPLSSGLSLENMDTTVHPGDDFQQYVNGAWIEKTEIPADKSRLGTFTLLRDKSEDNVKEILEAASQGENPAGSDEQKIGDLYQSYLDIETRNDLGISPLEPWLDEIQAISDYTDLTRYFAYAVKQGVNVPFNIFVMSDLKKPEQHALYSYQSGLGLPDREYYLSDEGNFPSLREAYVAHIEKMFDLMGLENGAGAAQTVIALETTLAENHMRKEETRNMMALYNAIPIDSLDAIMADFDWDTYFSEAGTAGKVPYLIVTQVDYMKSLNEIIPATSIDKWKTYLTWSLIDRAAGSLNEELDAQNFEFFGKTLQGIEEQRPMWRRAVGLVSGSLGEVIGKVYVKEHFPPEAKARMLELVNNLLKAYEVSIKELDWMGEETQAQALDKLSKFTPKIGYPDKWKEYEVEIQADDLFGNLIRLNEMDYQRDLEKLEEPVDKTEWGMTPQTVNAYYNPTMNEIVFPAAILQPPFFDMNADDAVNYGSIGGVIGHEIGHGFDDQGSSFDGDGVLRNWWTEEDLAEFKERTGALVEQYNQFEVLEDLNVNGEFTLGENIGDLGGLSIALKAYQMSLEGKEAPTMDGFTGVQRVFLGWAQGWKRKTREDALRVQVSTDPHSPAKFRVNGVVRNVPEFYEAFEVGPDQALYLKPEERVKIW